MPFFAKGPAAVQLSLLYTLRSVDVEITEDRLFSCVYSCSITDWFGFNEALGLILSDGYVTEVPRSFGQSIVLTDTGKKALELFEDTLTVSARKKMDDYLIKHRNDFLRAQQFSTQIIDCEDGTVSLKMNVSEAGRDLLLLQIALPSQEQALCMKSNWEKSAPNIYEYIYKQLLQKDGNKE